MQVNSITSTEPNIDTENTAQSTSASARNFDSYLNTTDSSLASIFQKAADTYNVPVSLLTAMAKQESEFQANATSKSGAMGIMQLMPATASYLGCSNPYDPEENIMAGAKYISQLLNKYNGDTSLALAAYNAGSGNVDKYGGIPPFRETQNYVAKITTYMKEGVTLPDGSSTTGSAASSHSILDSLDTDSLMDLLDDLFSYDDYLRFLNLFTKTLNETAKEPTASTTSVQTQNKKLDVSVTSRNDDDTDTSNTSEYYAYQQINYNNSVLNLLSQTPKDSL